MLIAGAAAADVGAGTGKPITPYREGEVLTEQRVLAVQKEANGRMSVHGVRLAGKNATKSAERICLARARGREIDGKCEFAFSGIDEQGKKRTIGLSNVESFRVVDVVNKFFGEDQVVVEVTEFPAITPAELLKSQPTYTALAANYSRKTKLTLGDVSLVGTDLFGDEKPHVIVALRDLERNADVTLVPHDNLIWWAIPSVTSVPAYPYRRQTKQ